MMENMNPTNVAESAERQLLALKKSQDKKIKEVQDEREYIVSLRRTLSDLIYATGTAFKSVYPQAEGFIEGRIKSPDSIEIKTRNEFTEVLSHIEENPNIDQDEVLRRISEIDFKDLFAFSVVTTDTPDRFKTGSDEKNEEFTKLSSEISIAKKRMNEHRDFSKTNRAQLIDLTNDIATLRAEESKAISKEEKERRLEEIRLQILNEYENLTKEQLEKLLKQQEEISKAKTKEDIEQQVEEKNKFLASAKINLTYGQSNLERTEAVYKKALRDLQYKMSEYYVENLSKFSTFKFWGTTPIRTPKRMVKPGFRAVNTGYKVRFSNKKGSTELKFEAQGKGGLDYEDAEFSALGAEYHEAQKTKDGIISKNIEMPDFTIIGDDLTKKIESEVRSKYSDISSFEDLEYLGMKNELDELKRYEQKITEDLQKEGGVNSLTNKEIRKKVNQAFQSTVEKCIQDEITDRINSCIDVMADSESLNKKIAMNQDIKSIYNSELRKLKKSNKELTKSELIHNAKIGTLYKLKENEIKEYAKTSIPIFFKANLPQKDNEEPLVYWFSTGESLYRFFVNRLNGLKDENGKYKYEPQEQQKKALLKLTGLFENDINNLYTYNRSKNEFGIPER